MAETNVDVSKVSCSFSYSRVKSLFDMGMLVGDFYKMGSFHRNRGIHFMFFDESNAVNDGITFVFNRDVLTYQDIDVKGNFPVIYDHDWNVLVKRRGLRALFIRMAPVDIDDTTKIIVNLAHANDGIGRDDPDYIDLRKVYEDIPEQYHSVLTIIE